ncbi:MAG: sensor hybrid histidine kinase [Acidobacteriales bacterium]|nr:sensor hybrid histidine kinase [Terriglobales bacterium]
MNPLPVQLEVALQTGLVVPWEYDAQSREVVWFEPAPQSAKNGIVRKTQPIESWILQLHPEDQSAVMSEVERAIETGHIDIQYRRFSRTGNLHSIRARGRLHTDDGSRKLIGVTFDLTERQRATLQLQTQQAVTRVLEEWSSLKELTSRLLQVLCETQDWQIGIMWSLDAHSKKLELFQCWAQAGMEGACESVSEKHDFAIGEGLPGRVWHSGKPVWIADVTKEVASQRFPAAQHCGIKSAFAFPIYLGSDFFGVMEFFSVHVRKENPEVAAMLNGVGSQVGQVIERRRAEAELRDSEESHRAISETASDAIITIDDESTIVFANPAVEQVFGYKPDEVTGKNLTMLMPRNMQQPHRHAISRFLQSGKHHIPWRGVEMPGLHKNGTELQLELSFGEFQRNGRQFFTGVVRDISSRRQAENALKSSEKLAATGRLAASMAHEINNPLTSVTNILYLLNLDNALSGPNRKLIEAAQQELQRVSHIVKQTLGFYRESSHPVETDMAEIVDGVLELFSNQIRRRSIKLVRQYRASRQIVSQPGELRQVVSNLIENALQATPDDGTLRVHLTNAVEPRQPDRPGIRLTISDTGSGIQKEVRNKIFEPFFTTKGERGTGLGLWVTSGIIEKHGGSIRFRSSTREGSSGTCFSVFVPSLSQVLPKSA